MGQATIDNIIRCMRIACLIPKSTDTHLQYVIITAFPLPQRVHEGASILRYSYVACLFEKLVKASSGKEADLWQIYFSIVRS